MDITELSAYSSPDRLRTALNAQREELRRAGHEHHPSAKESLRRTTYRGHEIVVRTSYSITVDGQPFDVQPSVNNAGLVHYHGLPTQRFASVLDLVRTAIDSFPQDFVGDGPQPAAPHSPHHSKKTQS